MNNQNPNPFYFHNPKQPLGDRNLISEMPLNITSLGPSPFRQNEILVDQGPEKPPEQTQNLFDFWKDNEDPKPNPPPFQNFKLPVQPETTNNADVYNSMNSIPSNFFQNKQQSQFSEFDKVLPGYPKFPKVGLGSSEQLSGFNFFGNQNNHSGSVLPDLGSTFNTYKNSILKPGEAEKVKCNMTISDINSNFDVYKANAPKSDFGSAFDAFKSKVQNVKKPSPPKEIDSAVWNLEYMKDTLNQGFIKRNSLTIKDPFEAENKSFAFLEKAMIKGSPIYPPQAQPLGYASNISKRSFESFSKSIPQENSLLHKKIKEKFGYNPGVDVTQMVEAIKMQMKAQETSKQLEIDQVLSKSSQMMYSNPGQSQSTLIAPKKPKIFIEVELGNPQFISANSSKEKNSVLKGLFEFGKKYSDSFEICFHVKESFWVKHRPRLPSQKSTKNKGANPQTKGRARQQSLIKREPVAHSNQLL